MAIAFLGSAVTGYIEVANDSIVFALENSVYSRVAVRVKRIVAQMDNLLLAIGAGTYMPILRTKKVTGIASGGVVIPKRTFDSLLSSDDGVVVRQRVSASDPSLEISVTGSPKCAWQQFNSKLTTAVGQQMTWDFSLLPALIGDAVNWVLYPGEVLFVEALHGDALGKVATGGSFFIQAVWEEDDSYDEGYTLSGKVMLNADTVEGAKVFVLTDLDADMPDPRVEVETTDASGKWASKKLASGVKAAAFVQYRSGVTKYTDEGKPYLEKP